MKDYNDLKNELKEIANILKEYPENLQGKVFDLLSKTYLGDLNLSETQSVPESSSQENTNDVGTVSANVKSPSTSKKRANTSKDSYKIVKTLNLKGDSNTLSLAKFCEDKITTTSIKFNVIASYYLKNVLNIEKVTPDHIYSCYKEMNIKVPTRLTQSLRDTASSKYGYLDTSDTNDIKVPITGENYVEHELVIKPKQ